MGVPAFFRWLSRKYPSVIVECVEKKEVDDEGKDIYEDLTLPNPNGIEFDNLYLDMNGIIHPCTHPEDKPAPKNEDEMMVAIFECIDRLFAIVRPRKVLYMAIDGVAPRAKMNQQRSRRFRASKEVAEKILTIQTVREELMSRNVPLPPEKTKGEHFDSNCITPGTPFMERLSTCLHYYIHDRMNSCPGWRAIKVILSDANVPGEGEHKLMDYIRRQRAQPDHDPNTQHVLCGADADLIMLGLATHEPNFTIIREEFLPNKPRPCEICNGLGHEMVKCDGVGESNADIQIAKEVQFIFVRLPVLKEYLREELVMPNLPFKYEFERVIDDWVFMCFFVGNDFLPHLPSLEIREGAIDRLVTLYKQCVYKTGGYLTDSGDVNLERVQMIMTDLGTAEDEIFKNRRRTEEQFKARDKAKKRRMQNQQRPNFNNFQNTQFAPQAVGRGQVFNPVQNPREEAAKFRRMGNPQGMSQGEQQLSRMNDNRGALDSMMRPGFGGGGAGGNDNRGQKRKAEDESKEEDEPEPNDEVRLWEDGFKDRYYESKFDVLADNLEFRYSVALQYVRGLSWVLKYYYQGCASWKWYFPYHYAPFASDFVNITGLSTVFEKNTIPFNPLEQLMGVFPAGSSSHVPEPWRILMSDPKSHIIDFYPEDFTIDLNGKKFAWQGVALLPFVDENRLFKALKPYYNKLTDAERKRNTRGDNRLYVGVDNPGYTFIKGLYQNKVSELEEVLTTIQGMQANVLIAQDCVEIKGTLPSPVVGLISIVDNSVLSVKFRDPVYGEDYIFPARRLANAIDPPKILKDKSDRSDNYRPQIGFHQNSGPRAQLGDAGHRMVNRGFSSVPPPANQGGNNQAWRSYGSNNGQQQSRGGQSGGSNRWQGNGGGNGGGSGGGGSGYGNNRGGGSMNNYGGGNFNNQQRNSNFNNRQQNQQGGDGGGTGAPNWRQNNRGGSGNGGNSNAPNWRQRDGGYSGNNNQGGGGYNRN